MQTLRCALPTTQAGIGGAQKVLRFESVLGRAVVLIRWLHAGRRLEETVPLSLARHRRNELEAQGAIVYWSERVVPSALG